MLLALDIGNSTIKLGFFKGRVLAVETLPTHPILRPSRYTALLRTLVRQKNIDKPPEGIIISSVVPGLTVALGQVMENLFSLKPFVVDHTCETGISIDIRHPASLGPDRIANAVAADDLFRRPAAVVDCGTATTLSVTGRTSNFIGGAILPGIGLMSESLAKGTARLPGVTMEPPTSALGRDTAECIRSGIFYGTAGAVERIIGQIEKETGLRLKIAVTGGAGQILSRFLTRRHRFFPFLTLRGLRVIYARNVRA